MKHKWPRIVAWLLAVVVISGFVTMAVAGVPGATEILITSIAIVGLIFAGGRIQSF
jgi:hypothetical protein